MANELIKLAGYAVALVSVAAITLTGIAVITGYKQTGYVDNTTADLFVTGLALFGTFSGIIILSVIGKTIVGLFKTAN